jgi:hypothetical protein
LSAIADAEQPIDVSQGRPVEFVELEGPSSEPALVRILIVDCDARSKVACQVAA